MSDFGDKYSYQSVEMFEKMEMDVETPNNRIESFRSRYFNRKNLAIFMIFVTIVPLIFYFTNKSPNDNIEEINPYGQYNEDGYDSLDDTAKKALFNQFIIQYEKTYNSVELSLRYQIFKSNLKIIDDNNNAELKAGGSAIHEINQFSDLSKEEVEAMYLNLKIDDINDFALAHLKSDVVPYVGVSTFKNWAGIYTTAIKAQKSCGACWAFAVTEQVESDAIRLVGWNKSIPLSTQQLVDCDTADLACNGGSPYNAYDYIQTNGQDLGSDYPYTSGTTKVAGTCMSSNYKAYVSLSDYAFLNNGDSSAYASTEIAMANYVLSTGTLSVMVAGSSWLSYTSGILTVCTGSINHAAQIVGIDTTNSYWIIRNSWGTTWGNAGFIYVKYGSSLCYLAAYPSYVTPYLKITKSPTRSPSRASVSTIPPTRKPTTTVPFKAPTLTSVPFKAPTLTSVPFKAPTLTSVPFKAPTITVGPTKTPTKVPTRIPSRIS